MSLLCQAAADRPAITDLPEAWFQPMGFTLRLLSNSSTIVEAAERSFGGFGPASAASSPDFTFYLYQQDAGEAPLGPPHFRLAGNLVYQTTNGTSNLMADQERGLAYGCFSDTVLANPAYFRWHFLELAFFVMLQRRGFMGVHGAALVRRGRAVLLRAPSGGGKTTLAYAGARQRFQALAEDVVWLDTQRGLWWGMPWHFHLLLDAKHLFPELASYEPVLQVNDELKLEVCLEQIRPGSTTTSAEPGPVVLVERAAGQQSRLERLDLATATQLWLGGTAGSETGFPNYHDHVERLLKDNTYRLFSGDDLDSSLDLLESLF